MPGLSNPVSGDREVFPEEYFLKKFLKGESISVL